MAANTLFYFVGSAVVDYDQEFLPLANVNGAIIFTVFPATVAVLLYAGLLRFTRDPARNFTIISAIVFVVTLIPDVTYIPHRAGLDASADCDPDDDARRSCKRDPPAADDGAEDVRIRAPRKYPVTGRLARPSRTIRW